MMDSKSNRKQTQDSTRPQYNKQSPLCAPLNIVPLLPLSIFLFFGLSLFFWELLTFFKKMIFFLDLGAHKK
jgi:hypothetical protein